MIKVSVVMPCLNAMAFLEECLESVLNQTLDDLEVLVVDAGSTDGTLEMLSEYEKKDQRLRIIHSDKKSMGHQYNLGIAQARGKYVGFCEMDDYVEKEMFATLYQWAEEYSVEYVKSDFNMFVGIGNNKTFLVYNIIPAQNKDLPGHIISVKEHKDILLRDLNMWNGIYNRNFLINNKIKLNETPGAAFQDMGFVLQVNMLSKRGLYERECFYNYRRDNSGSSTYSPKNCRYVIDELDYILKFMEKHPDSSDFRPYICKRFINSFFSKYFSVIRGGRKFEEIEKELVRFQTYLKEEWAGTSQRDLLKTGLWHDIGLRMFIRSLELHWEYAKIKVEIEDGKLDVFMDEVGKLPEIVIMGCGTRGKCMYTYMRINGAQGNIVFADNKVELQDKPYMETVVYSPTDATKKYPDAAYIISMANPQSGEEIRKQLKRLGIPEEHIYIGISIGPHQVTDVGGK